MGSELRHRGAEEEEVPAITSDSNPSQEKAPIMLKDQDTKKRWRNWWIRGAGTFLMLVAFALLIYMGPLVLCALIMLLQTKCYHEVISVGFRSWPKALPWFRSLHWYFVIAANYFILGENFEKFLYIHFSGNPTLLWLTTHHRFISFCLYILGFCTFVLSLRKGHYKFQFKQFAWTHMSLLVISSASQLIMRSIFNGLIWFLVPVCAVVCNDVMAYMFGFFFGKTPLIKLSPKKTWEGFIGAFGATLLWSAGFSYILIQFPFFLCPSNSFFDYGDSMCGIWEIYNPQPFTVPQTITAALATVGVELTTVDLIPAVLHSLVIATFASLIAPFGGFFASGLKRAFQVKDFDSLIPGHGGVTDRFDCQLVMAFFMFVYYSTFIQPVNLDHILHAMYALPDEDQLALFEQLKHHLDMKHLI